MAFAHSTDSRGAVSAATPPTRTEKGISLARGPALILGTILLAAGLYFLYKARTFPPFSNFPNGTAHTDGNFFLGIFGANGWTGMLTAVAGGLLLFGAAQHLLAKTMSLIVGVALGAAAVIAAISGDVLGMAAANRWTEVAWGACAIILLFNTLVPRRRRTIVEDRGVVAPATASGTVAGDRYDEPGRYAEPGPFASHESVGRREPIGQREPLMEREPAMEREPVTQRGPVGGGEAGAEQEPLVSRDDGTAEDPSVAPGATDATGGASEHPTTPLRRG